MSARQIRFGILGAGRITREKFAPALASTDLAVLHAAASRDVERARALGPVRAYDSYSALLEDPDVDAVYIGTHNGLHKDLTIAALDHGKHVLCEKPLGCTAEECEAMVAAAESAERHLAEAFMYRHHPQIAKAREMVRDGVIGEIKAVEASFNFHLTRDNDVRLRPEWGGGALLDVGCYCVNVSRLFLGDDPRAVHAWAKFHPEHTVDTSFQGVLDYASGTRATVSCSFEGGMYQRAALIGTDGVLELSDPFVTWMRWPSLRLKVGWEEHVTKFAPADTFRLEIENLCRAILDGAPPLLPAHEGLLNARILDRLVAAARRADG